MPGRSRDAILVDLAKVHELLRYTDRYKPTETMTFALLGHKYLGNARGAQYVLRGMLDALEAEVAGELAEQLTRAAGKAFYHELRVRRFRRAPTAEQPELPGVN